MSGETKTCFYCDGSGSKFSILKRRSVICGHCEGSGVLPVKIVRCLSCGGKGTTGEHYDDQRGRWVGTKCSECHGSGRVEQSEIRDYTARAVPGFLLLGVVALNLACYFVFPGAICIGILMTPVTLLLCYLGRWYIGVALRYSVAVVVCFVLLMGLLFGVATMMPKPSPTSPSTQPEKEPGKKDRSEVAKDVEKVPQEVGKAKDRGEVAKDVEKVPQEVGKAPVEVEKYFKVNESIFPHDTGSSLAKVA